MSRIVWKVADAPTGRDRSFVHRAWPAATWGKDGPILFALSCEDSYTPARARGEQEHGPLTIRVAMAAQDTEKYGTFVWMKLKKNTETLNEAKELAKTFFSRYRDKMNPALKENTNA